MPHAAKARESVSAAVIAASVAKNFFMGSSRVLFGVLFCIKKCASQETHPVKAVSRESLNKIDGKIRAK